jgi:malate synthase
MEDAATAEISRVQVWHWATHEVKAAEGTTITRPLVKDMVNAQGLKFQVHTHTYTNAHTCIYTQTLVCIALQCRISSIAAVLQSHVHVHVQ